MKTPDCESVLESPDAEAEQLATESVIVHIPQYSGMQAGDSIQLFWGGVASVSAPEANDPNLVFKIDAAGLESDTSSIEVNYVVRRS